MYCTFQAHPVLRVGLFYYAALQPRELLLVVDNVKQLLDGIDILAGLLAHALHD